MVEAASEEIGVNKLNYKVTERIPQTQGSDVFMRVITEFISFKGTVTRGLVFYAINKW